MKSGIYKIQNRETGRLYIGSSINAMLRLRKHKERLRFGKHCNNALQNAFRVHGEEAFDFSQIISCDKKDLVFYEQLIMDGYQSYVKPHGYNIRKKAESNGGLQSPRLLHKVGDKYGRLTLIKQISVGSNKWLLKCECGNEIISNVNSVKRGDSLSCGCWRKEKLSVLKNTHRSGDRYGRLTLVSLTERKKDGGNLWLVKCDCGTEKICRASAIRNGNTRSCGCLASEHAKRHISEINNKRKNGAAS